VFEVFGFSFLCRVCYCLLVSVFFLACLCLFLLASAPLVDFVVFVLFWLFLLISRCFRLFVLASAPLVDFVVLIWFCLWYLFYSGVWWLLSCHYLFVSECLYKHCINKHQRVNKSSKAYAAHKYRYKCSHTSE
jgi:hypothetical protein